MSAASAAYCSSCRTYVYVTKDGGCERGHPRSSLAAIYTAEIDRKTGRPKPPSRETQTQIAMRMEAGASVDRPEPLTQVAPVDALVAPEPPAVLSAEEPPTDAPTVAKPLPVPVKEPRAPMLFDVAGSAIWPADFMGLGGLSRLLNPPRGKHSAPAHAGKPPRGRHSTGATRTWRDEAS